LRNVIEQQNITQDENENLTLVPKTLDKTPVTPVATENLTPVRTENLTLPHITQVTSATENLTIVTEIDAHMLQTFI